MIDYLWDYTPPDKNHTLLGMLLTYVLYDWINIIPRARITLFQQDGYGKGYHGLWERDRDWMINNFR